MNTWKNFDETDNQIYKGFVTDVGKSKYKKVAGNTIANFLLFTHFMRKKEKLIQ